MKVCLLQHSACKSIYHKHHGTLQYHFFRNECMNIKCVDTNIHKNTNEDIGSNIYYKIRIIYSINIDLIWCLSNYNCTKQRTEIGSAFLEITTPHKHFFEKTDIQIQTNYSYFEPMTYPFVKTASRSSWTKILTRSEACISCLPYEDIFRHL